MHRDAAPVVSLCTSSQYFRPSVISPIPVDCFCCADCESALEPASGSGTFCNSSACSFSAPEPNSTSLRAESSTGPVKSADIVLSGCQGTDGETDVEGFGDENVGGGGDDGEGTGGGAWETGTPPPPG